MNYHFIRLIGFLNWILKMGFLGDFDMAIRGLFGFLFVECFTCEIVELIIQNI